MDDTIAAVANTDRAETGQGLIPLTNGEYHSGLVVFCLSRGIETAHYLTGIYRSAGKEFTLRLISEPEFKKSHLPGLAMYNLIKYLEQCNEGDVLIRQVREKARELGYYALAG
jgi:hypothetical protein